MPVPSGFIPRNNPRENYITCCDERQYQSDKNSKKIVTFLSSIVDKTKEKSKPRRELAVAGFTEPFLSFESKNPPENHP